MCSGEVCMGAKAVTGLCAFFAAPALLSAAAPCRCSGSKTIKKEESPVKPTPKKNRARFWLCIALILCLISCIGASVVQTDFGHVTIKDLRFETSSGHQMSALLLIPDTATADTPAPAIVCSHGWYNNREMQDLNYVEYARRGFVVLSIDMYGHGNSDNLPNGTWWSPENNANGMYDAVKMMAGLPFVDASRIGVTGHSNGALASRTAVLLDNEADTPLIAAALLVSNDAVYTDDEGNYYNMFGSRDAGIVACQYDEFFHRVTQPDGSRSAPRDYIHQATAQSFLYFGQDPTGQEERSSYQMYTQQVDGEEAIRVIYNPPITHPWAHFSKHVVANSVAFFDAALGAPNPIDGNNQIWQFKTVFNAIGLVGFMMFAVSLAIVLLDARPFTALRADAPVQPSPALTGRSKAWFWASNLLAVAFSFVVYMFGYSIFSGSMPSFFPQAPVYFIGMWSMLCGLFALVLILIGNKVSGKVDTRATGIRISLKNLGLTVLLALIVAAATYGLVFLADYFFKTDFRLWVLALKAFTPDKFPIILMYLPFFLVYYICNSISINCCNYFKMGRHAWVNTAVMAVFNGLACLIMVLVMYICFFVTGHLPSEFIPGFGGSIIGIWLYPILVILPVAAVVSRILYKHTRNPYLSGILMALLVTTMSCTNTLTQL